MHYKLLFPKKYLHALDLRGHDVDLTIREVGRESVYRKRGDEMLPIIYFVETAAKAEKTGDDEKRMICNVTNADSIADLHGTEVENWVGKRITIYAMPYSKSPHGFAIRIRPVVPPVKGKEYKQGDPAPDPVNDPPASTPADDYTAGLDDDHDGDGVVC